MTDERMKPQPRHTVLPDALFRTGGMPRGDKAGWIAFWTAYYEARQVGRGAVIRLVLGRLALALLILCAALVLTYMARA